MYHQLFEPLVTGSHAIVMLFAVVAVIRRLVGVLGAPVGGRVVAVVVVPPFGLAAAGAAADTANAATITGIPHATAHRRTDMVSPPTG